jgi:hypothetical protein
MKNMADLFLNNEHYKGGFMLKSELAQKYEIDIKTLKKYVASWVSKAPDDFPSFSSQNTKISPIEINRIIDKIGTW